MPASMSRVSETSVDLRRGGFASTLNTGRAGGPVVAQLRRRTRRMEVDRVEPTRRQWQMGAGAPEAIRSPPRSIPTSSRTCTVGPVRGCSRWGPGTWIDLGLPRLLRGSEYVARHVRGQGSGRGRRPRALDRACGKVFRARHRCSVLEHVEALIFAANLTRDPSRRALHVSAVGVAFTVSRRLLPLRTGADGAFRRVQWTGLSTRPRWTASSSRSTR